MGNPSGLPPLSSRVESKMQYRKLLLGVAVALLLLCAVQADEPKPKEDLMASQPTTVDGAYFLETFTDPIEGRWVKSANKMYTGKNAIKQQAFNGPEGIPGDAGLSLANENSRYGIAAPFDKDTVPGKDLVIQYELKLPTTLDCAGAYLKVLEGQPDLAAMEEKTSYTVMFGPDKCGATNKIHLILRFKNQKTGEYKEHHLKAPPTMKNDKFPHLYTAVLRTDNSFEIFVDLVSVKSGYLTSDADWETPFNPPKEIDDPDDKKPSDWVDNEKMIDPEAKKPADWDEDAPKEIEDAEAKKPDEWDEEAKDKIADPSATKPSDWDEDEDGPWEAPLVSNPKCKNGCGVWKRPMKKNPAYKGKWSAPMITNPKFKGIWKPKRIENPGYYVITDPVSQLQPMGSVAIEVWVFKPGGLHFDNILVGDDEYNAKQFGKATWQLRFDNEKGAQKAAEVAAKDAARKKKQQRKTTQKRMQRRNKLLLTISNFLIIV